MSCRRRRRGFTLVELLGVLFVLGLAVCLILPLLTDQRTTRRRSTCMSNHSQMGKACVMYSNVSANLGSFPHYEDDRALHSLNLLYTAYLKDARIFLEPSARSSSIAGLNDLSDPSNRPNLDNTMTRYGYDPRHDEEDGIGGVTGCIAGSPRTGAMDASDNSTNHGSTNGRGAGQNLLVAAGSVEWLDEPFREVNGQVDHLFVQGPDTQGIADTWLKDD